MKYLIIAIAGLTMMTACGSARKAAQAETIVNTYGTDEQLADTFLNRLQHENDVVIAAYTESLAWGRNYNYAVAARKNGVWKGYEYTIKGTRANLIAGVNEVAINSKQAEQVLAFLNNPVLWSGKDNHERCDTQVSDGSSSYLLMAAGDKVLKLKYYMPESYQKFCPDSSRGLFLDAWGRVRGLSTNNQ